MRYPHAELILRFLFPSEAQQSLGHQRYLIAENVEPSMSYGASSDITRASQLASSFRSIVVDKVDTKLWIGSSVCHERSYNIL